MRLLANDDDQVQVGLDLNELMFLHKALDEICDGFDFTDEEFQTVFDVPREEAVALVRGLEAIIERLGLVPHPD